MKLFINNIFILLFLFVCCGGLFAQTDDLKYNIDENSDSPLFLDNPNNIKTVVEYDPINNEYVLLKKVGDLIIERIPLSFAEYQKYDMDQMISNYWKSRSATAKISSSSDNGMLGNLIPQLKVNSELFETIFGGQTIDIRPSGNIELKMGLVNNRNENLALSEDDRSTTRFEFDMNMQINAMVQIGNAINFNLNFNSEATFDFENELKLKFEGKEDDIIQLMEAGNVSFPLPLTLIQGTQSLWGIKSRLKFGNLTLDAIISQQKSESSTVTIQGGAQMQEFNFKADEYDENRHFFLAQYFYDNYNTAMSTLPIINSNIIITKIEVWRTNIGSAVTNNRNLVAFADLGESRPYGQNPLIEVPGVSLLPDQVISNRLLEIVDVNAIRDINSVSPYLQTMGFVSGQNYEKIESARKLSPSEFTFNPKLGFISLNQSLAADQVLAVAFRYQIVGDTTLYQVGEFSDEGIADPNTLVVKLLKSSSLNVHNPMWKLMMKNVYKLNAYQISQEDFRLNILYQANEDGVQTGYFREGTQNGVPLIQVFGLDRMDNQQNMFPDGVFDFIDNASSAGGTVEKNKGLIYFPTVEPFGKDLREKLQDDELADKYCFDSLYTLTRSQAQQYPDKNKFYLEGRYKSSSGSEISLNAMNIPQGSVKVMAGGIVLTEGTDYTVDYAMGRVRIINQGYLNSGTPITVSTESNSTFSPVTKYMTGVRANYEVNKDFLIGATMMNLRESPLTQKVNYQEEPISNTIWGMDLTYKKEIPFITKLIDLLPFYQTKSPSILNLTAEFAHFIPGNPNVIGNTGTAYIDDFEAAKRSYDLKMIGSWFLASTPQDYNTSAPLFPETAKNLGLTYGFNRAKIAWYSIDDNFYGTSAPSNITKDDRSVPYARPIRETEVRPNKQIPDGQVTLLRDFNIAYYPSERGPYNYDTLSNYSAGLNADGTLRNPETRWGGIMRKLEATDFEATNIEYIEFWLMDPFIENPYHSGGKLYFNLGEVSEDILRDGRKSFENGLPTTAEVVDVDTTIWGRVPRLQAIVNAFSNDSDARQHQDVGYDGLSSSDEAVFHQTFLQKVQNQLEPQAYNKVVADPSADDFMYFRNQTYDQNDVKITDRYKKYNNTEGNSSVASDNSGYSSQATSLPNVEDINQDNTLSEAENYYEYIINLKPEDMVIGKNFITDIQEAKNIDLQNGEKTDCKWYQFKIPIREPHRKIGVIDGFQSIKFIRLFLKDFDEPIILRFATFELVSGEWRKYTDNLLSPGLYPSGTQSENTTFTVASVNIEENGKRLPIPYALPPGIEREKIYSTTSMTDMNEQSQSIKIGNLSDGDARAIYKSMELDMRQYKHLRMFVHAEQLNEFDQYNTGDLSLFIRLGTDFTNNYYEYEVPLTFTPWYTGSNNEELIWPAENEVDIDLEQLVKVKENRNARIRSNDLTVSSTMPYQEIVNGRKMTVVGMPNIAGVKVLMIGVRNPKKQNLNDDDDMLPKSAEIWLNELRLTDFNRTGGWAATGFARTNLADLGDVSFSASHRSAGFASLEQSISEISQDATTTLDVATNIEVGKFFPEEWGVRLPVHFDYSQSVGNPRYNPLDPDVKLENDLLSYRTEREKDSIRHMVQDYVSRTNFNLMNIRKDRLGDRALERHFYDIENWNASYSYASTFMRDVDIEYNSKEQHRGTLAYQYDVKSKGWKPFSKMKIFKPKSFAIIRDLTLHYSPKSFSFRAEVVRDFEETLLRAKSQGLILMEPYFFKQFYVNRAYTLKYDITSNIKFEYDATVNSLIEEPRGRIDTGEKKDSVWNSILELGRAQQFTQNYKLNVNIPINKIPIFDWVRINGSYNGTYKFISSSQATRSLGNNIENSRRVSGTANLNLMTLYNKVPIVKKSYQKQGKTNGPKRPEQGLGRRKEPDTKKVEEKPVEDSLSSTQKFLQEALYFGVRFVTSIKSASINYSLTEGTTIPGFMPVAKWLGTTPKDKFAPGFAFVFGSQDLSIMENSIRNGWLSKDTMLNAALNQKMTENINAQIKIEPIREFNIDISFKRNKSEVYSAYYKYNSLSEEVEGPLSPLSTGRYSISFFALPTNFIGSDEDNISQIFNQFLDNRDIIARRLAASNAAANPGYSGNLIQDTINGNLYPDGYGATSQQVLIPAFLAAYAGRDANTQSLSPFIAIPMPNWKISYTGLNKNEWVKKWANSITLSSNYACDYTVGAFTSDNRVPISDPNYDYGTEWVRNELSNNFIARDVIDQVTINEQFSPLLKMDINLKNSFQTSFEIRRERNLSLSFSNLQLTEVNRMSYVVGGGYRFKDVELNIRMGGGSSKHLKSDVLVKADFALNINKTVLRKIDQNVNLVSSGAQVLSLNLSGEYSLTERLVLKAYFEMTMNTPFVSNAYPNSTTQGGFSLRISL
jgi:cell surface protein SprA